MGDPVRWEVGRDAGRKERAPRRRAQNRKTRKLQREKYGGPAPRACLGGAKELLATKGLSNKRGEAAADSKAKSIDEGRQPCKTLGPGARCWWRKKLNAWAAAWRGRCVVLAAFKRGNPWETTNKGFSGLSAGPALLQTAGGIWRGIQH